MAREFIFILSQFLLGGYQNQCMVGAYCWYCLSDRVYVMFIDL
jgi:hypothetical protein